MTPLPTTQEHNPIVNIYNTHSWARVAQLRHNAVGTERDEEKVIVVVERWMSCVPTDASALHHAACY